MYNVLYIYAFTIGTVYAVQYTTYYIYIRFYNRYGVRRTMYNVLYIAYIYTINIGTVYAVQCTMYAVQCTLLLCCVLHNITTLVTGAKCVVSMPAYLYPVTNTAIITNVANHIDSMLSSKDLSKFGRSDKVYIYIYIYIYAHTYSYVQTTHLIARIHLHTRTHNVRRTYAHARRASHAHTLIALALLVKCVCVCLLINISRRPCRQGHIHL